jgi:hypothetical protein
MRLPATRPVILALLLTGCVRLGYGGGDGAPADRAPTERQVNADGHDDSPRLHDGAADSSLRDGRPDTSARDRPAAKAETTQPKLDLKPDQPKPKPDASGGPLIAKLPNTGAPSARRSTGAALQELTDRDRIWVYGGYDGSFRSELYSYDTLAGSWTAVSSGTPAGRERHSLAWAPANALVLFGGQQMIGLFQFKHLDELHLYGSGGTPAWTQVVKGGTWPTARKDSALVWIPHLGKLLLFGGSAGSTAASRFNDVWLLTVGASTASWVQLATTGTPPSPRGAACVAYDATSHRLVVFGGEIADGDSVGDTYQLLLDSSTWQKDAPTGTIPTDRSFSQCAWDPVGQRVVLQGGQNDAGSPLDGIYLYDPAGKVWSPVTSSIAPGPHSDAGAVWSPRLGGMFFFGGRVTLLGYTNDSWLLKPP